MACRIDSWSGDPLSAGFSVDSPAENSRYAAAKRGQRNWPRIAAEPRSVARPPLLPRPPAARWATARTCDGLAPGRRLHTPAIRPLFFPVGRCARLGRSANKVATPTN